MALGALLLVAGPFAPPATPKARDARAGGTFAAGADVSSLPLIGSHGGVYRDERGAGDPLSILHRHGVNWVRLRLWHSPADGRCGLAETLALARRARGQGLSILLDLHYSDSWADPGRQDPPAAWRDLDMSALEDSVRSYTCAVVRAFGVQGTPPAVIQTGNEISSGMLWDSGRVGGRFDSPQQWRNLGRLLNAAARGAREGSSGSPRPRVLLHVDQGGNREACRWFFDNVKAQQVEYDAIGVSFYPWWHGTLSALRANLDSLASRYGKDVYVVETAYPWTLQWFDSTANIVGLPARLHVGYAATAAGQACFVRDVARAVRAVPKGRGRGVFYWGAESITAPGAGSAWENSALFDRRGMLLPAADSLAAFSH